MNVSIKLKHEKSMVLLFLQHMKMLYLTHMDYFLGRVSERQILDREQ